MLLLRICDFVFTEMFQNLFSYFLLLNNLKKWMHHLPYDFTNPNQDFEVADLFFFFPFVFFPNIGSL